MTVLYEIIVTYKHNRMSSTKKKKKHTIYMNS